MFNVNGRVFTFCGVSRISQWPRSKLYFVLHSFQEPTVLRTYKESNRRLAYEFPQPSASSFTRTDCSDGWSNRRAMERVGNWRFRPRRSEAALQSSSRPVERWLPDILQWSESTSVRLCDSRMNYHRLRFLLEREKLQAPRYSFSQDEVRSSEKRRRIGRSPHEAAASGADCSLNACAQRRCCFGFWCSCCCSEKRLYA